MSRHHSHFGGVLVLPCCDIVRRCRRRPRQTISVREAADKTDEDRRTIAGIGEAEIEAALAAARRKRQETREDLALVAPWATPFQAAEERRLRQIFRLKTYPFSLSAFSANKKGSRPWLATAGTFNVRLRLPKTPTRKCRRTGTAKPRRQSANTRPRIQNQCAAFLKIVQQTHGQGKQ